MEKGSLGKVGYGLMLLTLDPMKKFTQEEFDTILKTVIDNRGYPEPLFLNSGEHYGLPDPHEGIEKLGGFFRNYPQYADQVYLSVKGGQGEGSWSPDVSPENLERVLNRIKQHLQPLYDARKKLPATLDMFTLARVGDRPIEDTVEALKVFQGRGYFKDLCLSEVGSETIAKIAKIADLAAVEIEFSLFVPDAAHNGVFGVLKQLDIPAVCYSPLGMGLLTDRALTRIDENGTAFGFDRFKEANWKHNKKLLDSIQDLASQLGVSAAKLSLSYITTISGTGKTPRLLPIPGSTNAQRQLENLSVIELNADTIKKIDEIVAGFERQGLRYNAAAESQLWR